MGNAQDSTRHVLVVRGVFGALGGAERELLQLIPKLENEWKVSLATLSLPEEAKQLLDSTTIDIYQSQTSFEPPIDTLSEVRNVASKQALRLWKSIAIPWDSIDVVHLSVCRGTLEILPLIPSTIPVLYHCLEPPRWLYEEVLHRRLDGTSKRPALLTKIAFQKQRNDDQRLVRMLLKRPNSTICGNSQYTANRLATTYKLPNGCTTQKGNIPQRDAQRRVLQSTFIHPAIDLEKWPTEATTDEQAEVESLNLPEKYVVTIGKILFVKGTMESVAMLENTGVALVQIGGGSDADKEELMQFAQAKNVHVMYMPRLSQRQICGVVRGSIAVVSHAHGEPFGLTPLEALAVGIPPMMVRDGGFVETMGALDEAYLFDRNDVESWRAGLERAQSEDVRSRCLGQGRPYVETHFSLDEQAEHLSLLLKEQLYS
ncbi:MAG: glycosyltransferase family 4 protein [Candidatus Poseidoniales archaeon]